MMEVSLKVPLGEQPHLKEKFAMMEENRMDAQAQNLEDFLQYFNQMEKYFEDMQDELLYLRGQLDELNDKTLKAKIDNFVKASGDRAHAAKVWLGALRNEVSEGIKQAVGHVKYYGEQALYTFIDKSKAGRALSVIHEHLEHSAKNLEDGARTMGDIGMELSAAKGHRKNAKNLLMGKDAADVFEYDYDKGIVAKIRQDIEFCGKIVKSMAEHTENMQKSLDGFTQRALDNRAGRDSKVPDSMEEKMKLAGHGKGR